MNNNFKVYRDNKIVRTEQARIALQASIQAARALLRSKMQTVALGIELAEYDRLHGTHLHREWTTKRKAERLQAFRLSHGL